LLVLKHGCNFIFIVPAYLEPDEDFYLQEAVRAAGVRVLVPLPTGSLSSKDFTDGFHLSPAGASRFTSALSRDIRGAIAEAVRKP